MTKKLLTISAMSSLLLAAAPAAVAGKAESKNVVEVAAGNTAFSTLVAAVKAAGLAEALSGDGPFTVFAPTDEAFAKLPEGTVETLLKPENKKKLQSILTYHVVSGSEHRRSGRQGHGGWCPGGEDRHHGEQWGHPRDRFRDPSLQMSRSPGELLLAEWLLRGHFNPEHHQTPSTCRILSLSGSGGSPFWP